MANADYIERGDQNGYTPSAQLTALLTPLAASLSYADLLSTIVDPIQVGQALMIDDEIMRINSFTSNSISIGRGCCDTVPAQHAANATIWFIDARLGSDGLEYTPTETVSVKLLPSTLGDKVPIEASPPRQVTFNWRFARPYPPAQVICNGDSIYSGVVHAVNNATPQLTVTWVHRDRVLQQDQLVDYSAASIGPEPGTTYIAEVHRTSGAQVALLNVPNGTTLTYTRASAIADFGISDGTFTGYLLLYSLRDGLTSLQPHRINFSVDTGAAAQPNGLGYRLGRYLGGLPA